MRNSLWKSWVKLWAILGKTYGLNPQVAPSSNQAGYKTIVTTHATHSLCTVDLHSYFAESKVFWAVYPHNPQSLLKKLLSI